MLEPATDPDRVPLPERAPWVTDHVPLSEDPRCANVTRAVDVPESVLWIVPVQVPVRDTGADGDAGESPSHRADTRQSPRMAALAMMRVVWTVII